MRIVMKFGGSSLADGARIRSAAEKIAGEVKKGNRVVAVVSAQGDTTDRLQALAESVCCPAPKRELDALLSAGEQICAALMAMQLEKMGFPAVSLTGWQAGIRTDDQHGDAGALDLGNRRIEKELEEGKIVVVAGFQGLCGAGDITTLGRGGSDTTAVALAAWLPAEECRIYTDVDGVYDKDPRIFPEAVRLETVDYDRMLAMARQGAQVLHDKCVELAKRHRVRVRVLSSFRPGAGTVVEAFPRDC